MGDGTWLVLSMYNIYIRGAEARFPSSCKSGTGPSDRAPPRRCHARVGDQTPGPAAKTAAKYPTTAGARGSPPRRSESPKKDLPPLGRPHDPALSAPMAQPAPRWPSPSGPALAVTMTRPVACGEAKRSLTVPAAVGRVTHVLALGLAIPVSDWPASSSSARIMLRADSRGHPECDSEIPSPVSRFEVTGNRALPLHLGDATGPNYSPPSIIDLLGRNGSASNREVENGVLPREALEHDSEALKLVLNVSLILGVKEPASTGSLLRA